MEHQSKRHMVRTFHPVSVGICHAQTATDRFGDGAKGAIRDRERAAMGMHPEGSEVPFTWPSPDSDDEIGSENSIYRLVPSMQGYRNNLTALSQAYNLYFVAYQGCIFVYVPRSVPKQTIPRHPDLQLVPKPSKASLLIGGCVDPMTPHTINHIITGFLGEEEVVVACFDDGDVIAYYAKEIADSVFSKQSIPRASQRSPKRARLDITPRSFFHENIGHSAWGLAVHRKSRLIAVSSNRCEVTVFAFALATCQKKSREAWEACECYQSCGSAEVDIPRRAINWRIVVALGHDASNIPNIGFVDHEDGQAEMICAVDIKGTMWLADIWKTFQPVTHIKPSKHSMLRSEEFWPDSSRGWGVLALAEHDFMKVDTVDELYGMSGKLDLEIVKPGAECPQPMVNFHPCIRAIPDNPCLPPQTMARVGQLYHHIPVGTHNEPLHLVAGAVDVGTPEDEPSDESDVESEESEAQSEEADDDIDQGSDGEEDTEDVVVTDDTDDIAANQSGPLVLFPPGIGAGLPFQPALQDLEEALGQLTYALQEFQEALSAADTPVPVLVQTSGDPDSVTSKEDERSTVDSTLSGDSYNEPASRSPPPPLDMAFFPHNGMVQRISRRTPLLVEFLKRPVQFNDNFTDAADHRIKRIAKRYRFLRTYEKDLELRSLLGENERGPKEIGILCPDAVTLGTFVERNIRPYFRATSRLSMLVHVPELSLVVVGSPIGRVLLLTPTKLKSRIKCQTGFWDHGFRLDCVLPRKSDEGMYRTTMRPLHGMAVGPVQDDVHMGDHRGDRAAVPRRYRLMLHYRNHDILTYELTREEQTGKLCIF